MIKVKTIGAIDEKNVAQITLENANGMIVKCMTLGCIVTDIIVPDKDGVFENVVCSFDQVEHYKRYPHFFGAAVGPFAGRLERGIVNAKGQQHTPKLNDGAHLLHGGEDGFHAQHWSYETGVNANGQYVTFSLSTTYENFPGNIAMTITYTLTDRNELIMTYKGFADEETVINATNHSYFNLSGNLKRTILQHELQLQAHTMLYIDEDGLPMPQLQPVEQSPFHQLAVLQPIIERQHPQILRAQQGIDHPFLLTDHRIVLKEGCSGRQLTITTDQRCAVIYTGQKIGDGYRFKEAAARNYSGICIEVQNVPNSILHPHLPSSIIKPSERYKQMTTYHFSVFE